MTRVTGKVYRDITTQFISLLNPNEQYCTLQDGERYCTSQDEATVHTAQETMNMLREIFDDRLINVGLWPPHSLTLNMLHIAVVTKKPMCQIMCFSLYCINGSIEGKQITLNNSNNTLLAMKSELQAEEFL